MNYNDKEIINEIANSDLMKQIIKLAEDGSQPLEMRILYKRIEKRYGTDLYNKLIGKVLTKIAREMHEQKEG